MLLVLFDVDGTLIATGGAGMRAFYRALRDVFGVISEDGFLRPDGKTDPLIVKELLSHLNLADRWNEINREALYSSYLNHLEDEMCRSKEMGLIRILPGVTHLLDTLGSQRDFCVGLVTGNLEKGARIKLEKAGLFGYFRFGGYGSDSDDRTILTRIGIRRGARMIFPQPVTGIFVIGDTPLDIGHAHAAGSSVIAVASGRFSMNDLDVHNPDLLLPDLLRAETIMSFMRSNCSADLESSGLGLDLG